MKQGIDVSSYQPDTLAFFQEAKRKGYDFAIVKTTESNNYVNPKAGAQLINASLAGLHTHTYHFARFAGNENLAVTESDYYVSQMKALGTNKNMYAFLDYEEAKGDRHEKQITSLENRSNKLEEYIRNEMTETNKSNKTIFISVGICIVTAVINLVFSLI